MWKVVQVQGSREYMEDRHLVILKFYKNYDLCAVFDGHGGKQVSDFCAAQFPNVLRARLEANSGKIRPSLSEAFLEIDARLDTELPAEHRYATGTTALVMLFDGTDLWVANTGDSRAIMNKGDRYAILSRDHKPNIKDERERIESRGGIVANPGGYGIWRVNGELAVSRAIGDKRYRPLVIPDPEVRRLHFDPALNRFFVIATDGLWDVVKNVEANAIVSASSGPEDACKKLLAHAMRNGMEDNTTIIVGFTTQGIRVER